MLKALFTWLFGGGFDFSPAPPPWPANGKFLFSETWIQWSEATERIITERKAQDDQHQQKLAQLSLQWQALKKQLPSGNDARSELQRRKVKEAMRSIEKEEYEEKQRYCNEKLQDAKIVIAQMEKELRLAEWERVVREAEVISSSQEERPNRHWDTSRQDFLTGFSLRERRLVRLKDGRYFILVFSRAGIMKNTGKTAKVFTGRSFGGSGPTEELAIMEWTGATEEPKLEYIIGSLDQFSDAELKLIVDK